MSIKFDGTNPGRHEHEMLWLTLCDANHSHHSQIRDHHLPAAPLVISLSWPLVFRLLVWLALNLLVWLALNDTALM